MVVVCPSCGRSNAVVPDYKPGSILACGCGEHLEFVRESEPPKVVPKRGTVSIAGQRPKYRAQG